MLSFAALPFASSRRRSCFLCGLRRRWRRHGMIVLAFVLARRLRRLWGHWRCTRLSGSRADSSVLAFARLLGSCAWFCCSRNGWHSRWLLSLLTFSPFSLSALYGSHTRFACGRCGIGRSLGGLVRWLNSRRRHLLGVFRLHLLLDLGFVRDAHPAMFNLRLFDFRLYRFWSDFLG